MYKLTTLEKKLRDQAKKLKAGIVATKKKHEKMLNKKKKHGK